MKSKQVDTARSIVMNEWRSRQPVLLDTSGAWHVCCRSRCPIICLEAHVCMQCNGVIRECSCSEHPSSDVVHVQDVYVCTQVGAMHVCDRVNCPERDGRCIISGLSCAGASTTVSAGNVPQCSATKRVRRRHSGVHTNEQAACIMLYDLLFSLRRRTYEIKRMEAHFDVARRQCQRIVRESHREKSPVRLQQLVDVYAAIRQRVRLLPHLVAPLTDQDKQEICRFYASKIVHLWHLVGASLPSRCNFDGFLVAVLYSMRRGVACDGLFAIPRDLFIAHALPDAHAITEIGLSRRLLTQSKNALFDVLQRKIEEQSIRVEQVALIFQNTAVPEAVQRVESYEQVQQQQQRQ